MDRLHIKEKTTKSLPRTTLLTTRSDDGWQRNVNRRVGHNRGWPAGRDENCNWDNTVEDATWLELDTETCLR